MKITDKLAASLQAVLADVDAGNNETRIDSRWPEAHQALEEYNSTPAQRLEYLRTELRAERISYVEIAELQALAPHIDPDDVELLEAAGVAEDASITDRLKITRPEIAIVVKWKENCDYEWDGDGEDPIKEGFYPYNVNVCASTIRNGELIEGFAYLGGCYSEDAGKSEPDINGYLDQLVEEAVAELDKQK